MTAKNLQKNKSFLEDIGFVETSAGAYAWDGELNEEPLTDALPWKIAEWNVLYNDKSLAQVSFRAELSHKHLVANLEAAFKQRFRAFRTLSILDDQQKGFWLLFEFLDSELEADQSRLIEEEGLQAEQLPHGLAGMHLSMIQSLGQLSVFMTKHFFIGNVPGQLFIELPRFLTNGLFGKVVSEKCHFSAYIATIECGEIRRHLLETHLPSGVALPGLEAEAESFRQVKLAASKGALSLHWNQDPELPELIVPPIEILEQKEVSRKFQRLDELILLEDYEGALKQCYDFLATSAHSLYLIRRLVFLTLWLGKPFERSYLEMMSKFDGHNLMAISLWIKTHLQDQNVDSLLEFLSRLGNSLGQAIQDFEGAEITSLTLPEMLGDAWNIKDDQRAVACYERVLQTRGEIPRILVKLIQLMRDLNDAPAEEIYMDRLLACEVPIRTRAAIYFRLAEIKEAIDLEEAVQWALKSWQTNRSHNRYALLAAKLLLALKRPHEAIHVLVETSEQGQATAPSLMRLELELRIAGIWMDELQRSDLAAERLLRAKELGVYDASAFARMIELASRLADPDLHVDILLFVLEAATRASDEGMAQQAIDTLVKIADQVSDVTRQGLIYSQVLTRSLLDANIIETIIANPRFQLPYDKILHAMELQIEQVALPQRGPYLQLMGDITGRMLGQLDRARGFYEAALAAGCLSQAAFDLLDACYAGEANNEKRYELLKRRYELAPDSDKSYILRELYYFDEGVSDEERDAIALLIYQADEEDTNPLEERISVYEQQGASMAIAHLLQTVFEKCPKQANLLVLGERGLQALQNCPQDSRFQLIHDLLMRTEPLFDNRLDAARRSLHFLWADPEKTFVAPYVDELVQQNEIPDYDPDEVLALLPEELPKVRMLLRLAAVVSENRAIGYLRRALRLTRNLPTPPELVHEIVLTLADCTQLQDDELAESIKLVRKAGQGGSILRIIASQLLQAQDDISRVKLSRLACEFLPMPPHTDLELLKQSLSTLVREQEIELKLAWMDALGFDSSLHTHVFAVEALRELGTWEHKSASLDLISRLRQEWKDPRAAEALLSAALSGFMRDQNEELLRFYFEQCSDLVSDSIVLEAFKFFATKRDFARAEKFLILAFSKASESEKVATWLQEAQELMAQLGMVPLLHTMLSEVIDPNRVSDIRADIVREVTYFYARYLVLQKKDLRKALTYFEQLHALDQKDLRFWTPMVQLYREFNADTDLYELLYRALPTLRRHPEMLVPFNLDLASLEQDFTGMGLRLGLMEEKTEATALISGFGTGEPAESDKGHIGPFGTHVFQTVDQRNLATVSRNSQLPPPVKIDAEVMSFANEHDTQQLDMQEVPGRDRFEMTMTDVVYQAGQDMSVGVQPIPAQLPPPPGTFQLDFDEDTQSLASLPTEAQTATHFREGAGGEATQISLPGNMVLPPLPPLPDDRISRSESSAAALGRIAEHDIGYDADGPAKASEPFDLQLHEETRASPVGNQSSEATVVQTTREPVPGDEGSSKDATLLIDEASIPSEQGDMSSHENSKLNRYPDLVSQQGPGELAASAALELEVSPRPPWGAEQVPPLASAAGAERNPGPRREDTKLFRPLFDQDAWRVVASQGKEKPGIFDWLLQHPCNDRVEQHLALQVAALFEDRISIIDSYAHRTWRQPQEFFYELRWNDRMGREQFHPGLKNPLARLMRTLYPAICLQFANQMNLRGIAERLKTRPEDIVKARRAFDWKDDVIQRGSLRFYSKSMADNGYHLFHLPKLEDRIQFDFEKKDIYIDREYYLGAPQTHLFHRLAFLSRALHLEYFAYLHLSPVNDLFPFLMKCRRSLEQGPMDNVKRMLGMEKDALKLLLAHGDREQLEAIFVEVGNITPDRLAKMCGVYVEQIYRLNLAETLDIVGIVESIGNLNLMDPHVTSLALLKQSALLRSIVAFAAELKFGYKPTP